MLDVAGRLDGSLALADTTFTLDAVQLLTKPPCKTLRPQRSNC